MLKHAMTLGLLAAVLTAAGGCRLFDPPAVRYRAAYGPGCGPGGGDCGECGECDDCVVARPGIVGRIAAHHQAKVCRRSAPGCTSGCDSACDACDEPCGAVCPPYSGPHCGPLSFVFSLFRCRAYCGCGRFDCSGCGERYWGEWDNSPDCCDTCGPGRVRVPHAARGRGYVDDEYETPAISARGHGGNCKNCQHGDVSSRAVPAPGYVRSSGAAARPSGTASRSSAHAPRIVSTTDRVVKSAKAVAAEDAARAEQVAEPTQGRVQR